MTILAGIDWSMTSPGITLGDTSACSFSDVSLHGFIKHKKQFSSLPNVNLSLYPLTTNNEDRFWALTSWAIDILKAHQVEQVFMEGYAYGATGKLAEIGENTGVLKHYLKKEGIQFHVFAPSEIKKFATTKGNANKSLMEECFRKETGICLSTSLGEKYDPSKLPAPVTDLIDSYFIWKLGTKTLLDSRA